MAHVHGQEVPVRLSRRPHTHGNLHKVLVIILDIYILGKFIDKVPPRSSHTNRSISSPWYWDPPISPTEGGGGGG